MAIEDQIEQLGSGIESSYEKVEAKGGTIPAHKNVDNLAGAIDSITIPPEPTGTLNITANGDYDVKSKASAHVDVPSGITPTGTISITDNGQVDVTQYATADVNVSGGGGGIPDRDISFSDVIPSSNQADTTLTIDTTGKNIGDLYISQVNSDFNFTSRGNKVASLIGQDGYFHLPVTINNESFDFKFSNVGSTYGSDPAKYANSVETTYYSGYIPVKLDIAHAESWNTVGNTTYWRNQDTTPTTAWSGTLYVVPLKFLIPEYDGVYYKKNTTPNIFNYNGASRKDNSSYNVAIAYSNIGTIPSRTQTGNSNAIYTGAISADEGNSHNFFVGGSYSVSSSDAQTLQNVGAGCVFLFVKNGYTLEDAATALETDGLVVSTSAASTFYYMDDGVEKQVGTGANNLLAKVAQDPSLKTKWDAIVASKPNSLTISIPAGDTTGNKFVAKTAVTYTKKLSELVGNLTTATFNITDSQTYTTRTFQGVVLAEQGVDLTDISPLSHGGYY